MTSWILLYLGRAGARWHSAAKNAGRSRSSTTSAWNRHAPWPPSRRPRPWPAPVAPTSPAAAGRPWPPPSPCARHGGVCCCAFGAAGAATPDRSIDRPVVFAMLERSVHSTALALVFRQWWMRQWFISRWLMHVTLETWRSLVETKGKKKGPGLQQQILVTLTARIAFSVCFPLTLCTCAVKRLQIWQSAPQLRRANSQESGLISHDRQKSSLVWCGVARNTRGQVRGVIVRGTAHSRRCGPGRLHGLDARDLISLDAINRSVAPPAGRKSRTTHRCAGAALHGSRNSGRSADTQRRWPAASRTRRAFDRPWPRTRRTPPHRLVCGRHSTPVRAYCST